MQRLNFKFHRLTVAGVGLFSVVATAAEQPLSTSAKAYAGSVAARAQPKDVAASRLSLETARLKARNAFLKAHRLDTDLMNRPWEILLKGLLDKIQAGSATSVQIPTTPQPADWSHPQYGTWRTMFYGDTMPTWGFTFQPQGGSSFADVYGMFLNSIVLNIADPQIQKNADDARDKWITCLGGLANARKQVGSHWLDFDKSQQGIPPSERLDFDTWYAQNDGVVIGALSQKCEALGLTYNKYFNDATQGLIGVSNAITKYASASSQVQAQVPGTDRKDLIYKYAIPQSLDDFVKAADASLGLAWDQTFTSSSGTYSSSTSTWGGDATYGFFFRTSASGTSVTIDSTSKDFSLTIQMKGLQAFDIAPDGWFSQAVVQAFKDGPFQPNSPIKQAYDSGTLYGSNGLFSLRTARIVVAYKPTIRLHLAASNYHEARSSWSGSGGIGIGPFSFDVNVSGSSTNVSFDNNSNTITVQDLSNVPQLFAVITNVLPTFK